MNIVLEKPLKFANRKETFARALQSGNPEYYTDLWGTRYLLSVLIDTLY